MITFDNHLFLGILEFQYVLRYFRWHWSDLAFVCCLIFCICVLVFVIWRIFYWAFVWQLRLISIAVSFSTVVAFKSKHDRNSTKAWTRSSPGLANCISQFTILTMLLPLNISETYYEHFPCKLHPWLWHLDTPTDRNQLCKDTTSSKHYLQRQHLKTVCFLMSQEQLPIASKLRND